MSKKKAPRKSLSPKVSSKGAKRSSKKGRPRKTKWYLKTNLYLNKEWQEELRRRLKAHSIGKQEKWVPWKEAVWRSGLGMSGFDCIKRKGWFVIKKNLKKRLSAHRRQTYLYSASQMDLVRELIGEFLFERDK